MREKKEIIDFVIGFLVSGLLFFVVLPGLVFLVYPSYGFMGISTDFVRGVLFMAVAFVLVEARRMKQNKS